MSPLPFKAGLMDIWRSPIAARQGFGLMEIALALAILGVISGFGLLSLPHFVRLDRHEHTERRLDRAENALFATIVRENRLLCPADPALGDGAAVDGCATAATDDDSFSVGALPWASLGLAREDGLDARGRQITYAVSNRLVGPSSLQCVIGSMAAPAARGVIPVLGIDKTALPPAGGRAAFVLITHGPNGLGAFTSRGGTIPVGAAGPAEAENLPIAGAATLGRLASAGAALHGQAAANDDSAPLFDDRLRVWTTPALLLHLGCQYR